MPVGPGRFRVRTTKTGKKIRLHFTPSGRVNEAKNLESGATHTPSEFSVRGHPKKLSGRARRRY